MPPWQKSSFFGNGRGGRPGRKEMRESIVSGGNRTAKAGKREKKSVQSCGRH